MSCKRTELMLTASRVGNKCRLRKGPHCIGLLHRLEWENGLMLECLNVGMLECSNVGMFECWNEGAEIR
jgi:hypothetical protein